MITQLTVGTFSASVLAAAPGNTPWTYTANDVNLDFLAVGETITFSFTVTATDNHSATDTDVVTITITGTNNATTVTATPAFANFTEDVDASARTSSTGGTVNFDDIDTNDTVSISSAYNSDIVWTGGVLSPAMITQLTVGTFSASVVAARSRRRVARRGRTRPMT